MPPILRTNPIEVANRLDELGWNRDQLLEVVGAMVSARNSCTENDPASAPGWMAWKEGTRRLREIARPMGMEKDDTDQIPSVVDERRGVKFAVSNTDDGTGLGDRIPQNRSRKGPATDKVVCDNQGSLIAALEEGLRVVPISIARKQPGMIVGWYLCLYCQGDDIRAELSCPVGFDADHFTDFVERIILIGPEEDDPAPVRGEKPDEGSDFEIPVSRKR